MIALLLAAATVGLIVVEYAVRPGERRSADGIAVVRAWKTYRLPLDTPRAQDGSIDVREVPPDRVHWHLLSLTAVLAAAHAGLIAWVLGW